MKIRINTAEKCDQHPLAGQNVKTFPEEMTKYKISAPSFLFLAWVSSVSVQLKELSQSKHWRPTSGNCSHSFPSQSNQFQCLNRCNTSVKGILSCFWHSDWSAASYFVRKWVYQIRKCCRWTVAPLSKGSRHVYHCLLPAGQWPNSLYLVSEVKCQKCDLRVEGINIQYSIHFSWYSTTI